MKEKSSETKNEELEVMKKLLMKDDVKEKITEELEDEAKEVERELKRKDFRYLYEFDQPKFEGLWSGYLRKQYDKHARGLGFESYDEYKEIMENLVKKTGWFEKTDVNTLDRARKRLNDFHPRIPKEDNLIDFYKTYRSKKNELQEIRQLIEDAVE